MLQLLWCFRRPRALKRVLLSLCSVQSRKAQLDNQLRRKQEKQRESMVDKIIKTAVVAAAPIVKEKLAFFSRKTTKLTTVSSDDPAVACAGIGKTNRMANYDCQKRLLDYRFDLEKKLIQNKYKDKFLAISEKNSWQHGPTDPAPMANELKRKAKLLKGEYAEDEGVAPFAPDPIVVESIAPMPYVGQ